METNKISNIDFVNSAYSSPVDGRCRMISYLGSGTANGVSFRWGLAALTFPGQRITITPDSAHGKLSILEFSPELLPDSIQADESCTIIADPGTSFIRYFQASCALLSEHPNNEAERLTTASLLAWFTCLASRESELENTGNHSRQLVEQAKEIIHREYASDLTLQAIATELFVNPCYLSTVFHHTTGYTFREYLKHVRLRQACHLLTQTNHLISDIAMQTGFNSNAYLISSFRKEFGVTPNTYRSMHTRR